MDCSEQIKNILDPAYTYTNEDFNALLACNDPELLDVLDQANQNSDYQQQRRVRKLLSMRLCLHLLDLMVSTTEHNNATASLLHLMISAKQNALISTAPGNDREMLTARFPDIRAADHLLTLLYRDDTSITWVAAQALALISDATMIYRLHQQLKTDDPVHQMKTALALAWYRDSQILPMLLAALSDEDWLVRELACNGLRVLADERGVESLTRIALIDEESLVRSAAVEALGDIGGPQVIDPLIKALHDPDEDVRAIAARQLGALQYPQAIDPLVNMLWSDPDLHARLSAIEALRDMECEVEPIIAALRDENPEVRAAAAGALEYYQDPRSFEPLIKVLDDTDPHVRFVAADTLGELHTFHTDDPAVIEKIRSLLRQAYGH